VRGLKEIKSILLLWLQVICVYIHCVYYMSISNKRTYCKEADGCSAANIAWKPLLHCCVHRSLSRSISARPPLQLNVTIPAVPLFPKQHCCESLPHERQSTDVRCYATACWFNFLGNALTQQYRNTLLAGFSVGRSIRNGWRNCEVTRAVFSGSVRNL
jgi:hypothetical protein